MDKDLENRFTYHRPTEAQQKIYPLIRDKAKELAYIIKDNVPNGREQALALTKLEEVVMWANAGVSRQEEDQPTKQNNLYAMVNQKVLFNADPFLRRQIKDELMTLLKIDDEASINYKHKVEGFRRIDNRNVVVKITGDEYLIDWFIFYELNGDKFIEVQIDPLKI